MIDFRYHLVSIIAIFLALAVGIVVGTTALNGLVLDGLKASVSALTGDKRALEGDVTELRQGRAKADEFTQLTAPVLLRGALSGQRVLLLSTPDAPSAVRDDLTRALGTAGASLAGDVRLRPDLVDPAQTAKVASVVTATAPAELALPAGSPAQRAAAELTAALVKAPGGLPAAGAQKVLAGFAKADLLDIASPAVESTATLVLLVSGPAPGKADEATGPRTAAGLALVKAFAARAGVVVAGPATSADDGALVAALRGGSLDLSVSSIDDADSPQGLVASVLALVEQVDGSSGSYGTGRGATATAPTPRPPR